MYCALEKALDDEYIPAKTFLALPLNLEVLADRIDLLSRSNVYQ